LELSVTRPDPAPFIVVFGPLLRVAFLIVIRLLALPIHASHWLVMSCIVAA
jgi:hypothetical protein